MEHTLNSYLTLPHHDTQPSAFVLLSSTGTLGIQFAELKHNSSKKVRVDAISDGFEKAAELDKPSHNKPICYRLTPGILLVGGANRHAVGLIRILFLSHFLFYEYTLVLIAGA